MPDQKLRPLTDDGTITRTVEALAARNFDAVVAQTSAEALVEVEPNAGEIVSGPSQSYNEKVNLYKQSKGSERSQLTSTR